jgi:WD40 repeat protein
VRTVAVTPDGRRCLIGYDGTLSDVNAIDLYNLDGDKRIDAYKGHQSTVTCVAFSADGSRILSGGNDGTLRLWDVREARELRSFRDKSQKGHINDVAFLAGGKRAVSTGDDGYLRVWNVESGKAASPPRKHHSKSVSGLAVSADGRLVLTMSEVDGMRLWRLPP